MFKKGLVSISFRDKTPSELITAAKKCGLSCIEWGSDVHAPCLDTQTLKIIKAECDKNGIECCSYGTYFRIGENSSAELADYIKAAKILGTNILRLWCGNKNSGEYSKSEKEILFNQCRELAEIAEKENVFICMECHNNTFTDCLDGYKELFENVRSENFKMYWQPNQYKTDRQNIEYAKTVAENTVVIHAFNWKDDDKFPLKENEDLWKKYLSLFKKELPVLLEFMPDGDIRSLKNEADAIKRIAGEE